jgi:excisionase family DNA binding protein
MNRRPTQFGMRENTASSRQHASRLAVNSLPLKQSGPPPTPHGNAPTTLSAIPASQSLPAFVTKPQGRATGGETRDACPLLTIKEVADLLRVPVTWVYGRTRKRALDRLPGYRLGKYWRFSEDEVLAWVRSQRGVSSAS